MSMHELISPRHLARKAIIYVRQSTSQQTLSNQESLRLCWAARNGLRPTLDGVLAAVQHPLTQQAKTRAAEHLAFERLELVHKPLGLPLAPVER